MTREKLALEEECDPLFLTVYHNLSEIMGNSSSVNVNGANGEVATSIFDFNVDTIENQQVSMSKYRGKKAYLLVNVARL